MVRLEAPVLTRLSGKVDGMRHCGLIRVSLNTVAFGQPAVNERQSTPRLWLAHPAGWLCAGVLAAAVVLCVCVPDFNVRIAGAGESAGYQRVDADDDDSVRIGVDDVDAEAELESVQQAHLKVDSQAPKSSGIKQVAIWPLTKRPTVSSSVTKLRQSQYGKWNQTSLRDPFAEADNETPSLKSSKSVKRSTTGSDSTARGIANGASDRRRLLDYQAAKGGPTEDTAESRAAGSQVELTQPTGSPSATAIATSQSSTEAELRALFEQSSDEGESASAGVSRVELQKFADSNTSSNGIRQVSQGRESQAKSAPAEPDNQVTSIPLETLQFRARQAQQSGRAESARQLRLAAAESGSVERSKRDLLKSQTAPALAALPPIGPETVTRPPVKSDLPALKPNLVREVPGRARVDQVTDEPETMTAITKARTSHLDPAITVIPTIIPEKKGRRLVPATGTADFTLEIRPARKPGLPEPQVLANRPLELPAPEGWSAATKLESARRAAQWKTPTVAPHAEANAVSDDSAQPAPTIRLMANRGDILPSPEMPLNRQVTMHVQPVKLDAIEQIEPLPLLDTDVIGTGTLKNADYQDESVSTQREPAKIAELNVEPIIVPQLAAEGRPLWVFCAIAAGGVLFGLYGMWRAGPAGRRGPA